MQCSTGKQNTDGYGRLSVEKRGRSAYVWQRCGQAWGWKKGGVVYEVVFVLWPKGNKWMGGLVRFDLHWIGSD